MDGEIELFARRDCGIILAAWRATNGTASTGSGDHRISQPRGFREMAHVEITHALPRSATAPATASVTGLSIGEYLIRRLQDYGIGHVFGIPGRLHPAVLFDAGRPARWKIVTTTREDCAGFAADAYARVHGMGAVCVTYCVGGLSLCNSVAGAYAEKSPVVVITGSPGLKERHNNPLLHHRVRDFRTQYDVFEKLCIAGAELNDPLIAFHEIDRVLHAAARYKRPVYIEIPRDMVGVVPATPHRFEDTHLDSDPARAGRGRGRGRALARTVASGRRSWAASRSIASACKTSCWRWPRARKFRSPPRCSARASFSETHPLFVGLYEGAMGNEEVTQFVEESDCLLLLGTFMTDINLGIYTANLDPGRCIYATSEQLRIRHHHFHDVLLADFMRELADPPPAAAAAADSQASRAWRPRSTCSSAAEPIRISRLIARLNESLTDETVVIADIGDALFAATELVIRGRTEFVSPAYYTSMGFSVPAALGTQIARPDVRTVVHRRRRRVPDDRHRVVVAHPAQVSDDRDRARQRRLRHRAVLAPRQVRLQRRPALGLPQAARGLRRRQRLRRSHRRRVRRGAESGLGRYQRPEPDPRPARPGRPQHGAETIDREAEQAGVTPLAQVGLFARQNSLLGRQLLSARADIAVLPMSRHSRGPLYPRPARLWALNAPPPSQPAPERGVCRRLQSMLGRAKSSPPPTWHGRTGRQTLGGCCETAWEEGTGLRSFETAF